MSEPRKATDVLLDLENKVDRLLSLLQAQDLNNKVLSNKMNEVMELLKKQGTPAPKITVETVNTAAPMTPLQKFQPTDPERQVPIFAADKLPETNTPQGFRRSSRPETYAGDDVYLGQQGQAEVPKFSAQTPKGAPPPGRSRSPEVVVPQQPPKAESPAAKIAGKLVKPAASTHSIPVHQRVVDKNGKSIFLADVEVVNPDNDQTIHKTRTNGTGKWQASLGLGNYRVVIKKRESVSKTALEAIQHIQVDGSNPVLELPVLIIK